MSFRGSVCAVSVLLLALVAASSAFAPSTPSPAAAGRSDGATVAHAVAAAASPSATAAAAPAVLRDFDHRTAARLPYSPTGYSTWQWKTRRRDAQEPAPASASHAINYLELGDPSRPALLLVHGFGASSYHFRHNVPILARRYHVYALDLLGFGWSDKPLVDYEAEVWRDQVVDFVRDVVWQDGEGGGEPRPVVLAGNSLGGFTAMYAAADARIQDGVKGCVLLNSAGRFRDPDAAEEPAAPRKNPVVEAIAAALQRFVLACAFAYTKQPARIDQVLRQVYPADDAHVDAELVASIREPSLDANAAEVFYRVVSKNGSGPPTRVDDVLRDVACPVCLAWGERDPWIRPAAADRLEALHAKFHGEGGAGGGGGGEKNPAATWIRRVNIDAGHCPHDEAPEAVNDAILSFMEEVLSD